MEKCFDCTVKTRAEPSFHTRNVVFFSLNEPSCLTISTCPIDTILNLRRSLHSPTILLYLSKGFSSIYRDQWFSVTESMFSNLNLAFENIVSNLNFVYSCTAALHCCSEILMLNKMVHFVLYMTP